MAALWNDTNSMNNRIKSSLKETSPWIVRRILGRLKPSIVYTVNQVGTWGYQIRNLFCSSRGNQSDIKNKKVSVIIPTLSKGEQSDHLPKLQKLLEEHLPKQTHQNYEAIVYCDGINEKVEIMVAALKDPRIKIFSTKATLGKWGHPQTRMGIEKAGGEYFVRINDDNIPYQNYLHELVSSFERGTGIVYGRVLFGGDARRRHQESFVGSFIVPGDKKGELKRRNIDCMCYMVKMDLAKKYRECFSDAYAADWFFIQALLGKGIRAEFVDKIIGEKF